MKNEFEKLKQDVLRAIKDVKESAELEELRVKYFGRKGELAKLMKKVKGLAAEQRPVIGKVANEVKLELEKVLDDTLSAISPESSAGGETRSDPTLPGRTPLKGTLHPITQVTYELNDAFAALGFEVYAGPELSSEGYAFDNLNFPPNHPARETMDTFWLDKSMDKSGLERLCLRPHLTGASVRYMQTHKPPFRFVYPGRVFRSEATDASHERAFYQYEALIIDKDVSFSSGKVLIETALEAVFGRTVKTRMRLGFFPFVEPGFETDMACLVCGGKGCSVCGRTGWVEMMPGGTPHPNVLKAGGIDPREWTGFYVNIGLDRIAMMRHGIDDIRLFNSGDLRFLQQF